MHPRCCLPATSWVHYTTSFNTQSSAPEDGQNNCLKHVEPTGIINKPLLLYLVGCLYYLYQWCTVKQISDNEIYLLIKYIQSVLWRVAKCLSYIEEARCLKVNEWQNSARFINVAVFSAGIGQMAVFWFVTPCWTVCLSQIVTLKMAAANSSEMSERTRCVAGFKYPKDPSFEVILIFTSLSWLRSRVEFLFLARSEVLNVLPKV